MEHFNKYLGLLISQLSSDLLIKNAETFTSMVRKAWKAGNNIFICGNGGSAGNAIHIANDFIYGAGTSQGVGVKVEALTANPAVLTCLANDIGYENVFSEQLRVKASPGDLLLVLSGSGNSANVIRALETGRSLGMTTISILGFDGGICKEISDYPLHFPVEDMQIAEDLQLILAHMCMQFLSKHGY